MIEVSFMEEDQYGTQKTPISTSKIWILKISPVSWILFHNFSISTNKQKQSFLFTITANTFQRHFCGRGLSHSLICPINTVYVKDFRSSPLLSPQTHKNPRNRQNTQTLILNMKRRNRGEAGRDRNSPEEWFRLPRAGGGTMGGEKMRGRRRL